MTITKIAAALDQASQDKLKAKSYDSVYTDIPQSALPSSIKNATSELHAALTGEPLGDEDYTWTVYAKDGKTFSSVLSPSISLDESGQLQLMWGNSIIPIEVNEDNELYFPNSPATKIKLQAVKAGKWENVGVTTSTKIGKDTVIMPLIFRVANLDDRVDADVLAATLESGEIEEFKAYLATATATPRSGGGSSLEGKVVKIGRVPAGEYEITSAKKLESKYTPYLIQTTSPKDFTSVISVKDSEGNWTDETVTIAANEPFILKPNDSLVSSLESRLNSEGELTEPFTFTVDLSMREVVLAGPVFKLAHCPLGRYEITGYRAIASEFTPFLAQSVAIEDFSAETSRKVDGEWIKEKVSVLKGSPFIFKPNGRLNTGLSARPILTEETPGYVEIISYGEWNGYPTAEIEIEFNTFSEVENELKLRF